MASTTARQIYNSPIVVEHKDRFARFGFTGYKTLLKNEGRDVEVVNEAANGEEDLLEDLVYYYFFLCPALWTAKMQTEDRKDY